jgi:ATP-dependent phosphofructokinase / diphosphate-dependent phosphofructokinase
MTEVFVIAQGGGPTAVINATVAGAVREVRRRHPRARIIGARHGVRGIRDDSFIDLTSLSDSDLQTLATTPSAAFGSTRDKPDEAYCAAILDGLKRISATSFIYIGGNDTAGTLKILDDAAGDSIAFIHAPKTIDNDLAENDHTPGYISAAWFVASAFHSCDLDVRALPGIYVGIVMGRNAGFLTAAAAAWRRDDSDGPHLLYLPERIFSMRRFLEDIAEVRDRYGRCVIAMSEGVEGEDGRPLVESLLGARTERDAHGNIRLGGGDLGVAVQNAIAEAFPGVRARVDTFGYLPRAFATMVSEVDRQEAFDAGTFAVATKDEGSGSVAIGFDQGRTAFRRVPLDAVAGKTRTMPTEFVDPTGTRLSAAGMTYLSRLIPPAPETFRRGFDTR